MIHWKTWSYYHLWRYLTFNHTWHQVTGLKMVSSYFERNGTFFWWCYIDAMYYFCCASICLLLSVHLVFVNSFTSPIRWFVITLLIAFFSHLAPSSELNFNFSNILVMNQRWWHTLWLLSGLWIWFSVWWLTGPIKPGLSWLESTMGCFTLHPIGV